MLIPYGFDEANEARRKRVEQTAIKTAEKLNQRLTMFLEDISKNPSISPAKRKEIKEKLLKHI